jgi:DNA-binding LacI/PurR family transcriptional regulator
LADRKLKDCEADVVMVDNEAGAYQAVSHLISLNFHRIGMIMDNPEISTNVERSLGYRKAFHEARLPIDESLIQACQYTHQSAHKLVLEMLKQSPTPDALFTTNNFMTIGALKAVRELELKIPEDVALVGFDELDWNGIQNTDMTVVAQPVNDIGKEAANRLISRINHDSSPIQEIRLKTRFIIRDSCGAKFRNKS